MRSEPCDQLRIPTRPNVSTQPIRPITTGSYRQTFNTTSRPHTLALTPSQKAILLQTESPISKFPHSHLTSPHLNPLLTRNNNPSPPTYPTRKSRPSIRIQPKKPHIVPNQTPSVNEPIHVISKPIKTKINKKCQSLTPVNIKKRKALIHLFQSHPPCLPKTANRP